MQKLYAALQHNVCQFLDLKSRARLDCVSHSWQRASRHPASWIDCIECQSRRETKWALSHGCKKPKFVALIWKSDDDQEECPFPVEWQPTVKSVRWENWSEQKDDRNCGKWLPDCVALERLHLWTPLIATGRFVISGVNLPVTLTDVTGHAILEPGVDLKWLETLETVLPGWTSSPAGGIVRHLPLRSIANASRLQKLTVYWFVDVMTPLDNVQWTLSRLRVLRLPFGEITRRAQLDWLTSLILCARDTLVEIQLPFFRQHEAPQPGADLTSTTVAWGDPKLAPLFHVLSQLKSLRRLWFPYNWEDETDNVQWHVVRDLIEKKIHGSLSILVLYGRGCRASDWVRHNDSMKCLLAQFPKIPAEFYADGFQLLEQLDNAPSSGPLQLLYC